MYKEFEVGKRYECANMHLPPITVLSRTNKNMTVFDGKQEWGTRIYIDDEHDEWCRKSEQKVGYKGIYTYSSAWEIQ